MSHIFISYSRKDLDFAQKIVTALADNNLDTWIDWKSIPKGEDWEQEIYRGIEEAGAFLFLISLDSVASEMCNKEIAHAVKNGKRILPIVIRDTDPKIIHPEISKRNWIFCRDGRDDFDEAIVETRKTIHTDYEWRKYHTELQVKALKWEQQQDASRLLRGKELREAEGRLVSEGSNREPRPTDIQRKYILESQRSESRSRRRVISGLITGILVMLAIAIVAVWQWQRAEEQSQVALSRQLAAQSSSTRQENQLNIAALLSVEAISVKTTYEARENLFLFVQQSPRRLLTFLPTHGSSMMAFSPNGRILASGDGDTSIVLWDMANPTGPTMIGQLPDAKPNRLTDIAFHPNNQLLATATDEGVISLWDISTVASPILTSQIQAERFPGDISFSPNGKMLVAGGGPSNTLFFWDVSKLSSPAQFFRTEIDDFNYMESIVFRPDGKILATGRFEDVLLWDLSDHIRPKPFEKPISADYWWGGTASAFSPDGKTLAVVYKDEVVTLWDVSDPTSPRIIGQPFSGHPNIDEATSGEVGGGEIVAFSPDGKVLATSRCSKIELTVIPICLQSEIYLWDVSNLSSPRKINEPMVGHNDSVNAIAFSPDGTILATGAFAEGIILWDVIGNSSLRQFANYHPAHDGEVTSFALQSSHNVLASGGRDGNIILWEISDSGLIVPTTKLNLGSSEEVTGLAFVENNMKLAASGSEGSVTIWSLTDPSKPLFRRSVPAELYDGFPDISINPNGRMIAFASGSEIYVWNLSDRSSPRLLNSIHKNNRVADLAFSPDGKILVIGDWSGSVYMWDVSDSNAPREIGQPLTGHQSRVTQVVFSQNGKMLITGGDEGDGSIFIWDIRNPAKAKSLYQNLQVHAAGIDLLAVTSISISADNKTLAASSCIDESASAECRESVIRLWDITTPNSPRSFTLSLPASVDMVNALAFSPDNKVLISSTHNGGIIIWDIGVDSWMKRACQVSGRNFTQSEWQQYLPNQEYRITCPQWPAGQ